MTFIKARAGMTLVEALVVLAILAIASLGVVPLIWPKDVRVHGGISQMQAKAISTGHRQTATCPREELRSGAIRESPGSIVTAWPDGAVTVQRPLTGDSMACSVSPLRAERKP